MERKEYELTLSQELIELGNTFGYNLGGCKSFAEVFVGPNSRSGLTTTSNKNMQAWFDKRKDLVSCKGKINALYQSKNQLLAEVTFGNDTFYAFSYRKISGIQWLSRHYNK